MTTYRIPLRRTPSVPRVTSLSETLARHGDDGPLVLDLDDPAVRATLALYVALKPIIATSSRRFHDAEVGQVVRQWLRRIGLSPDVPLDGLHRRIERSSGPTTRPARAADEPPAIDDINLDRVAEHVRAAGVDCEISTPGCGVAVLQAGPPTQDPHPCQPWNAIARPGRYGWDGRPSTATTRNLLIGPDDLGETTGIDVRAVGALTEPDIAALVVAQARRDNSGEPLSTDEIRALGFDPPGLTPR